MSDLKHHFDPFPTDEEVNEARKKRLSNFSDEELEVELRRRKSPQMLSSENVNLSKLMAVVKECVDSIVNTGSPTKDCEQYIFEAAMETFYGDNFFFWWNDMLR